MVDFTGTGTEETSSVTIVATVGGSTSNSYITLATAETILAQYLAMFTSGWTAATDDNKAKALIQATRDIDTLNLKGVKYSNYLYGDASYQPLHFPIRKEALGDTLTIPPEVQRATVLQAAYLLRSGTAKVATSDIMASGIKSQGIGHYSNTISNQSFSIVCPEARAELKDYLVHGARLERR